LTLWGKPGGPTPLPKPGIIHPPVFGPAPKMYGKTGPFAKGINPRQSPKSKKKGKAKEKNPRGKKRTPWKTRT